MLISPDDARRQICLHADLFALERMPVSEARIEAETAADNFQGMPPSTFDQSKSGDGFLDIVTDVMSTK
jgi:hypothetical protein